MKKIKRKIEVKELKEKISGLIKELGVSKNIFKRNLPRVTGSGYKYFAEETGHKQSIRQQYMFLLDLIKFKTEKKEKENGEGNAQ